MPFQLSPLANSSKLPRLQPRTITSLSSPPSSLSFLTNLLCARQDIQALQKHHTLFIVSSEINFDVVSSKLINLYSRFHRPSTALSVFKSLENPGTVTWNSIMKAHIDSGMTSTALSLYRRMRSRGIPHDSFTLPILNAVALHLPSSAPLLLFSFLCVATRIGFYSDTYFCNTFIHSCHRSGLVSSARQVFNEMPIKDAVSWTLIIANYTDCGNFHCGIRLFSDMLKIVGINPVTSIVMLQACSYYETPGGQRGSEIHGVLVKSGTIGDVAVKNSLLLMYSRTGYIKEVDQFLHEISYFDVFSWNILISHYSSVRDFEKVIQIFADMRMNGFNPNCETLTLVVSSCSSTGNLCGAKLLHCFSLKRAVADTILLTSLLDCYSKCGQLSSSVTLYADIEYKSNVTGSAMVSAFSRNGYFGEAFDLFRRLQGEGCDPSPDTLNSITVCCSGLGTLQTGKEAHGYSMRRLFLSGLGKGTALATSLLNMYMRNGCVTSARDLFNQMSERDTMAWTSMIDGCGSHGFADEAFELFERMVGDGCRPNGATFLSLLAACSHSGRVSDGCRVFCTMWAEFGVEPELEHITSVVDMVGRSGDVVAALRIILKTPAAVSVDSRIWGALLGAAVSKEEWKVGEFAAERILELEPDSMRCLVVLGNLQAMVGRWGVVEKLKDLSYMKKEPAQSYIEANGGLHGFACGDSSHPQSEHVYQVLFNLSSNVDEFAHMS